VNQRVSPSQTSLSVSHSSFFSHWKLLLVRTQTIEHIELPAKLLGYFSRSDESNINQHCLPDVLTRGRSCPCQISCFCSNRPPMAQICNEKKRQRHADIAFQRMLTNLRHPQVRNAGWLSAHQMVTCHQYWVDSSGWLIQDNFARTYLLPHARDNNIIEDESPRGWVGGFSWTSGWLAPFDTNTHSIENVKDIQELWIDNKEAC